MKLLLRLMNPKHPDSSDKENLSDLPSDKLRVIRKALCLSLAVVLLIIVFALPDLYSSINQISPRITNSLNYVIFGAIGFLLLAMHSTLAAICCGLFLILCNYFYHSLLVQMGAIVDPEHFRMFFLNPTEIFTTYSESFQKSLPVTLVILLSVVLLIATLLWGRHKFPKFRWALTAFLMLILFVPLRLTVKQDYLDFKPNIKHHSVRALLEAGSIFAIRRVSEFVSGPQTAPNFPRRTLQAETGYEVENDILVVFIMGESITANNMSMFGYDRDTTPHLKARAQNPSDGYNWIAKKGLSYSSSSNSTFSQFYNLSDHPFDTRFNVSTDLNIFRIAKTNGFEVSFLTSQIYKSLHRARPRFIDNLQYREINRELFVEKSDEMLLDFISSPIPKGKQFLYLYQWGNHAPFIDRCKGQRAINIFPISTDDINQTWRDEYDNGLRCWDKNTDSIIAKLTQQDRPVFIFLSADHSVLLGEHALRGHGHHYIENHIVPMVLYTNRPDHPTTKAFRKMVGTHYELSGILARTLGARLVGGTDPSKEIYLGKSAAFAGYDYMKVTRDRDSEIFDVEYWYGVNKTGQNEKAVLPFLAEAIDALK